MQVREQVFIEEQNVPVALEWDGKDNEAIQVLARDENNHPIATARMLDTGQIGRMAVLPEWRKKGIGSAMLIRLISQAQRLNYPKVFVHAQTTAVSFYERFGFVSKGEEFMDADMPHLEMARELSQHSPMRKRSTEYFDFMQHVVGEDNTLHEINDPSQLVSAIAHVTEGAGYSLDVLSYSLTPEYFNQEPFISNLKEMVKRGGRVRVRFLLCDSSLLYRNSHAVLDLARKVSSYIDIRLIDNDDQPYEQSMIIADRQAFIFQKNQRVLRVQLCLRQKRMAASLTEEFERLWNRGHADPNLRKLHI